MQKSLLVATLLAFGSSGLFAAEKKVDFAKDIQPIFEKSCVSCHGPEKQKGDLRLDSKQAAIKGGKAGAAIVPGKAEESEAYRRIILPADHDDVMPSKGDLLTREQTDIIRDWINQGATWPEGTVAASTAAPQKKLADIKPTPAELKAVAELEKLGVAIRPIAMNVAWKEASYRSLGTNATDAQVSPLKDVLSLVDLNLAGTRVTDAGLASLKNLTNLTRLHLEHTSVTDVGLTHLRNLRNLEYLNLFNTPVTDAGLKHLEPLGNLKRLYVWQTKVTDAGIAQLQKALPELLIQKGWESAPAKTDEQAAK